MKKHTTYFFALLFLAACNNAPKNTEETPVNAPTTAHNNAIVAKVDMALISEINSQIIDSVEFTGQEAETSGANIYWIFYDKAQRPRKAYLAYESISGDVVDNKRVFFNEHGQTILGHYRASVIPEDFSVEIWAGFSEGRLAQAQVESSNKELKINTTDDLRKEFPEPILSVEELKKAMASAVRKSDYIPNLEEAFDVERGAIPGTEKSTFADAEGKRTYTFGDLEVTEIPFTDEKNDVHGQELVINQAGFPPLTLPKYKYYAASLGKYKNYLFVEYSEGFWLEIHVFDLKKRRFVYDSRYQLAKVEDNQLIITREIKNASNRWLPACEKEKAVGQGVQYNEIVKINLSSLEETPTGQIMCSVAQ